MKGKISDVMSLITSPYYYPGNELDIKAAEWIKENCDGFDGQVEKILHRARQCLADDFPLVVTEIFNLILSKPRRFSENEEIYKAIFNSREEAPWAWEKFLKNAEKINKFNDWAILAKSLGYGSSFSERDSTPLFSFTLQMMCKTAKPGDWETIPNRVPVTF
ncbi:MAG: hypothetical protein WA091_00835 [Minisyncoccales bacterium]